jgi:tetratricopeptide (TPR) repeat protein
MMVAQGFLGLGTRLRGWWRGRDWRLLVGGVPVLLAGAGALTVAGILYARPESERTARYLAEARTRFKAQDYAGAMTCYDRLAHLGKSRPEILFGLAQTAQAMGEQERAALLMTELAPRDGRGYGEAHLWWARRLLSDANPSPQMREAAERHLLRALDGELEDREAAHGLLGELYLNAGKLGQAETHLLKAVPAKPQLRLRLAQLYALRGDKDRARREGLLAVSFFRAWAEAELTQHQARLSWADADIFLDDYPAAVEVLREGLNATGESLYRTALARAYVSWSDFLGRDGTVNPGDQLALLEKALEYDPNHLDVTMRLWALTRVRGEAAEKARTALRAQLASGKASALTHLALGMDAWERKKQDEALLHLEQAYQLAPQMGVVANNLAWVLANAQPPDLPRALALSNSLLERWPEEPMFRDTRGQVHLKMGHWKEALKDLETALRRRPEDGALHRALAETYRHLDMPEMAVEHERRADSKGP